MQESGNGGTIAILSGTGVDEVFTRTNAVGQKTLLSDGLGSTLALYDESGRALTQYSYEPFGQTTSNRQSRYQFFRIHRPRERWHGACTTIERDITARRYTALWPKIPWGTT